MIVQSSSALKFDITWAAVSLAAVAGIVFYLVIAARRAARDPVAQLRAQRGLSRTRAATGPRLSERSFAGAPGFGIVPPIRGVTAAAEERASPLAGTPEQRRGMRKQARVLGLVSAAACCSPRARARPRHRPGHAGRRQPPASAGPGVSQAPASSAAASPAAEAAKRPAPAPVGPAGAVRRLLRGRGAGLLRRRRTSTSTFVDGGPTVVPQQVGSAPDGPEFTISWVPKVLEARESGSDLVDIAQIFQRSGTLSVTWKDTGLDDLCKLAGKKVGVWDFGNEFEVTAGLGANCGLTPGLENNGDPATQYQKVIQDFDMVAFLNKEIDAAEAMIYNEYAQVLEATNPETGELYKPEDLNVFNWNDYRSSMLQDAIFAREAWLKEGTNRDVAVRFVRASLKGWIYCRDNPADCVQYTTRRGQPARRRPPGLA